MVYGRLNNITDTARHQSPLIYIYTILFLTISNNYTYTTFKLYVHKLETKGGESMIIYERNMVVNIKN